MINKKNLLFIASFVFLGIACSNQSAGSSEDNAESSIQISEEKLASISGVLKGSENQDVFLQELGASAIIGIDTIQTDEQGNFSFSFSIASPGFFRVGLTEQNMCVLIVYPNDEIKVKADASSIYQSYEVEGSKESNKLKELNGILAARDSINMVLQNAQMTRNQQLFQESVVIYNQITVSVDADIKDFISKEPGTLASLAATQNLNMDNDFQYYKTVVEALKGKADGNEFYETIKTQVQSQAKLAIGAPAPEISLPQPSGEVLKLSDLRGQYVLIDFWASWCGPCRKENPNVRKVYAKYHDKGFEILGVSLDKNSSAWLNAIQQDGLQWKHISDLKYWQSSVVPEYQIKGIPLTFLVDPEGNIVAKNLRGPSLEAKLAEIFGE
ncbi:AhpC/TSA family protein [Salibacteraceae bacterium]|jgi:peroxiredoxin|nr:AhpC/TSA family protein [Salibacteraceae bacterium]MDB9709826.1 AhpC/TSA family protein [Salibacteraceae bacterium]